MSDITTELVQKLHDAGAHVGYSKARRHPSTQSFIYTTKTRGDIIDIEKTAEQIADAEAFLKNVTATGRQVLFVGSKPEASAIVKNMAEKLDMPYIENRWLGGTLTNKTEIEGRIKRLRMLLDQTEKNALVYQTKKEKLMLERELEKLKIKFGGLLNMTGRPAAIIVIDPLYEAIAVTEAAKEKIPVIALANTDCDLANVACPIVANDAARATIKLVVEKLGDALKK